ncbi:hypothetical protein Tsubulata_048625 [Turnera subulata]|uniref:Exocyst subunit Exo70 family protein n=1 Tax=Turnera subulata TaxID=218843 RepID=A0A9Q0JNK8_9ROSI|nr:hypothetical protein Tsubulata_048625 [Turnera subulata]
MVLPETPRSKHSSILVSRKGLPALFFTSAKTLSSSSSFASSPTPSSPIPFSPVHRLPASAVEENIANAEAIITKWDPNSSSLTKVIHLFHYNHRNEAKEFLQRVNDLRRAMHFLISEHSTSDKLVLAQNLMRMAMSRLEKEFYQILSATHDRLDPESVSGKYSDSSSTYDAEENDIASEEESSKISGKSISDVEKASALAMSDLKAIADCMVSSGYGKECVKIYKLIRKSIVDEALYLLGVEQYKCAQIQKLSCEALEHMIKKWINAMKTAVKTLFNGEKTLCDHVFSASQRIRQSCFSDITKDGAINLVKFPELLAKRKTLPEKIFPLLEVYEVLSYLWPEIDLIFNSESSSAIKMQALTSLQRLGESVCTILSDFESTIQKDSTKAPIEGGGVHPLTQTVMNYISSLADYSGILSEIVAESPPKAGSTQLPESYFESPTSDDSLAPAVSTRLAWLILVLLCKLDIKAEVYKDRSLFYLFMANNLQFVIEKVCTSRLRLLLGEDWVFKHATKVIQYASNYETIAWGNVFSSLPEKIPPELSPEAAKDYLKGFNTSFEEAYNRQRSCIVQDEKLRDELKTSIGMNLIPAYRELYQRCLEMFGRDKKLRLLLKFSPEDLGNYLSDLFHGTGASDRSLVTSLRGQMPR